MILRCTRLIAVPRVGTLKPSSHDDETLQVFAANLLLRGKLSHSRHRSKRRRVARRAIEDRILDR